MRSGNADNRDKLVRAGLITLRHREMLRAISSHRTRERLLSLIHI